MDAHSPWDSYPATADIDLAALAANAQRLRAYAPGARHMGIVKADAYGHGRAQVAKTLAQIGYDILGAAQLSEALALRAELDHAGYSQVAIFSWMLPAGDVATLRRALEAGIEVSVSSVGQLDMVRACELPARIHLKVDTGMGRAGVPLAQLPQLAEQLRSARDEDVRTVGVWSHLARADEVGPDAAAATRVQRERFEQACATLEACGLSGLTRHLAATSGVIWHPDTHYDMVRDGIGLYGLSPDPSHASSAELGLQPVMTLRANLNLVKQVPAGQTVSYGGTWSAEEDSWLGVVPLGYGDGIPRHASNCASVRVQGAVPIDTRIVGRVCMDQFVVNLGAVGRADFSGAGEVAPAEQTPAGQMPPARAANPTAPARAGDEVILFSNPQSSSTVGCPSADDWAQASGTINYEIVTRIGARVPRRYQPEV